MSKNKNRREILVNGKIIVYYVMDTYSIKWLDHPAKTFIIAPSEQDAQTWVKILTDLLNRTPNISTLTLHTR